MKTDKISRKINIKHKNIIYHIYRHLDIFKEFGNLEIIKSGFNIKGGRPSKTYNLNDNQIKFLIMLLKNDTQIIQLKKDIILNKFDIVNFKKEPVKGSAYIIKNENGYKIGSSINFKKRIRCIETQQGKTVDVISVSKLRYDYKKKEIELHKRFKHKKIIGEYFNLSDKELKDAICILFDTTLDNIKLSSSKYLYDNDKKSYIKLYLIELGQILDGKESNLYIFPATIEIANIIFQKEKETPTYKIYEILEKEVSKYLDLYFSILDEKKSS